MSTVISFRARASAAVPAGAAGDLANSRRDGPYPRQNSLRFIGSGQPAGKDYSLTTWESFHAALQPGPRWLPLAAEMSITLRFVPRVPGRLVLRSLSAIAAAMRTIRQRQLERRIAATLKRLDDAILKDSGVCRMGILHVVRTRASAKWRV